MTNNKPITRIGGGVVNIISFQTRAINISGGTLQMNYLANLTPVQVGTSAISNRGKLDLEKAIADISSTSLGTVTALAQSAFAGGTWNKICRHWRPALRQRSPWQAQVSTSPDQTGRSVYQLDATADTVPQAFRTASKSVDHVISRLNAAAFGSSELLPIANLIVTRRRVGKGHTWPRLTDGYARRNDVYVLQG